jgi:hypothetical protein
MDFWQMLLDDVTDNGTDILKSGHERFVRLRRVSDGLSSVGRTLSVVDLCLAFFVDIIGVCTFWSSFALNTTISYRRS